MAACRGVVSVELGIVSGSEKYDGAWVRAERRACRAAVEQARRQWEVWHPADKRQSLIVVAERLI